MRAATDPGVQLPQLGVSDDQVGELAGRPLHVHLALVVTALLRGPDRQQAQLADMLCNARGGETSQPTRELRCPTGGRAVVRAHWSPDQTSYRVGNGTGSVHL